MRALIQDVVETTQVRDRQGNVVVSFSGTLLTFILRVFMVGLFVLAIGGIIAFIGAWVMGSIDPSNANFGFMN
jgi:hypothetical protein|tara:strand:+ start:1493 stop:1711 length:219 start_codon:yes stop_codon:yes gene_type:complete